MQTREIPQVPSPDYTLQEFELSIAPYNGSQQLSHTNVTEITYPVEVDGSEYRLAALMGLRNIM